MIDILSFILGLAAAGIPLFILLCYLCDKAWWLGIHDYRNRKHPYCTYHCHTCDIWRSCLQHEKPDGPEEPVRGELK